MDDKTNTALSIENIYKSYGSGEARVQVINGISVQFEKGKICTILGPSGSGKSTLMNIIGGLDTADSGKIYCSGEEITKMKPKALGKYRRNHLGFVFQMYNLIPNLTVKENIQVCEYLTDQPMDVDELIEVLGLTEHKDKFPSQLSGGQQQRCAIGRALVKKPNILLCDEPTGALDYKTSKDILVLLEKINKKYNTTMIIITHNTAIKDMSYRVVTIRDGKIASNKINEKIISAADLEW